MKMVNAFFCVQVVPRQESRVMVSRKEVCFCRGEVPLNHILIADDEPSIGSLIEATLQGPDARTTHVTTGPGVLEAVRQEKYDLIVLDWMMPGMTGLEVLKALRLQPEMAAIPVIMLPARGQ